MPGMQLHNQQQLTRLWSRRGPSKQKAAPNANEWATSRVNRSTTQISGGKESFAPGQYQREPPSATLTIAKDQNSLAAV